MTDAVRFRSLFAAAALFTVSITASGACKSDTRHQADRAAKEVNVRVQDLKKMSRDLAETSRRKTKDIADEAREVGNRAHQLENANNDFKYRKMVRIGTLRAVHAVAASQPMLIHIFSLGFALIDKDRAEVAEKLAIFQMRLDEAGNVVQSLELVEANDWEIRDDAATRSMDRVEDARMQVWDALHEAKRISDVASMRCSRGRAPC